MIAMDENDISFFKDGLRLDGRRADELRPVKIEVGILARADGSCYIEMGGNKVIAAVYGPREVHPRHLQEVTRAIVRYRYNMASFSVEERKRPGPDRRSYELSKVSREALEPVILSALKDAPPWVWRAAVTSPFSLRRKAILASVIFQKNSSMPDGKISYFSWPVSCANR